MPHRGARSVLLVATLLAACRARDAAPRVNRGSAPSPGDGDRGVLCLDVGDVRACWGDRSEGADCRAGTCLVRRPLPDAPRPPSGFRCSGQRGERACVTRAWNGPPFACHDNRCVQSSLRVPDNGEWECVEMGGAAVCRALAEAAGIPGGVLDAAFVCGARLGSGERICVDLSPDPPPGLDAWSCRVTYGNGPAARVCASSKDARVGGRCASRSDCPVATECIGGRCLPDRPNPACWFDQDCAKAARCRYGSCRAEG